MRFITTYGGEDVTDDIDIRVDDTVSELEALLVQAIRFRAKMKAGVLEEGDTFLDFTSPMENGYDRTGPNEVKVEKP